ncbi:MAG: hypothetical protein ACFFE5_04920 [Candidatus Thorarchaeota archaeon]
MNFFRRNVKVLAIIGGFLSIFSILLPTEFHTEVGNTYFVWINQLYLELEPTPFAIGLLRLDLTLVIFSIAFGLIIVSSSIAIITATLLYQRFSKFLIENRGLWLTIASLIVLSTLAWIIMMEIFYNISGYNHWVTFGGGYIPHFGVIGPFIGSGFIVLGILLDGDIKNK